MALFNEMAGFSEQNRNVYVRGKAVHSFSSSLINTHLSSELSRNVFSVCTSTEYTESTSATRNGANRAAA